MAGILTIVAVEASLHATNLGSPAEGFDVLQSWEPNDIFEADANAALGYHLRADYSGEQLYRNKLDGSVVHRAAAHTTPEGLRAESKRSGGKVLLAVGDSTTFGVGVADGESGPAALERRLPAARRVENAGVPGRNLAQNVEWIRTKAKPLAPSIVLLAFYLNDLLPAIPVSGTSKDMTLSAPTWTQREAGARRWSRLLNLVCRVIDNRRALSAAAGPAGTYMDEINRGARTEDLYREFEHFRKSASAMGAKPVIVILPVLDVADPRAADPMLGAAEKTARSLSLPVINAKHALDDMNIADRVVLPAERHASAAGNEAIAHEVFRQGAALGLW